MNTAVNRSSGNWRSWVEGLSWCLAILSIALWSSWPAVKALSAALELKKISKQSVIQGSDSVKLEIQRNLQKHFLEFGVYVPLEDIMFTERVTEANPELEATVNRVCGNAPLVVWIPLQFRLPLVGERSLEWCWKPSLKS